MGGFVIPQVVIRDVRDLSNGHPRWQAQAQVQPLNVEVSRIPATSEGVSRGLGFDPAEVGIPDVVRVEVSLQGQTGYLDVVCPPAGEEGEWALLAPSLAVEVLRLLQAFLREQWGLYLAGPLLPILEARLYHRLLALWGVDPDSV